MTRIHLMDGRKRTGDHKIIRAVVLCSPVVVRGRKEGRKETRKEKRKEGREGDFPGGAVIKNPPANAGDAGSIPGLGRSHMPWSS